MSQTSEPESQFSQEYGGKPALILVLAILCVAPFASAQKRTPPPPSGPGSGKEAVNSSTLPAPRGTPAAMTNGPTVIDADYANIEKASGIAVFSGNVGLKHPQFHLKCEKLTIWIRREAETGPRPTPSGGGESSVGRLDKALAVGGVEIVQDRVDENGKKIRNVGRGAEATFESGSGDLTLKGNPEVEADGNMVRSTDERTIIILNQKQTMRVLGRHTMLLSGGS